MFFSVELDLLFILNRKRLFSERFRHGKALVLSSIKMLFGANAIMHPGFLVSNNPNSILLSCLNF